MSNLAKVEYRVRQSPRYHVTRFYEMDSGAFGVETYGVYDNSQIAEEVAYALCSAEHLRLGWPPGDDRVKYPEMTPSPGPVFED